MPGVYEGGLKVWEASLDLVEHLVCPNGAGGGGAGADGVLFAREEAMGVPGRRKRVLEVHCWETEARSMRKLCGFRFRSDVCVGWGMGF